MLNQIGTIGYKNNEDKIIYTKKLFEEQQQDFEINKQEFLEKVKILSDSIIETLKEEKGVLEMQKNFEDYKEFCKENSLKADRYSSLEKYLNNKQNNKPTQIN